jgi:hypothetical protein
VGNSNQPDKITRLEFMLSQAMLDGEPLRVIHAATVHLDRIYNLTADHECGHDDCIIPGFRQAVGPYLEWMKEQEFGTLPTAAIYMDLNIRPEEVDEGTPDFDAHDILRNIEDYLNGSGDD